MTSRNRRAIGIALIFGGLIYSYDVSRNHGLCIDIDASRHSQVMGAVGSTLEYLRSDAPIPSMLADYVTPWKDRLVVDRKDSSHFIVAAWTPKGMLIGTSDTVVIFYAGSPPRSLETMERQIAAHLISLCMLIIGALMIYGSRTSNTRSGRTPT